MYNGITESMLETAREFAFMRGVACTIAELLRICPTFEHAAKLNQKLCGFENIYILRVADVPEADIKLFIKHKELLDISVHEGDKTYEPMDKQDEQLLFLAKRVLAAFYTNANKGVNAPSPELFFKDMQNGNGTDIGKQQAAVIKACQKIIQRNIKTTL